MAGLNFYFNRVIAVSPSGSITPFGTKASSQAENKAMGRESNIFASESLGKIMNGVTLISIH